jgi:hypothetical protein
MNEFKSIFIDTMEKDTLLYHAMRQHVSLYVFASNQKMSFYVETTSQYSRKK